MANPQPMLTAARSASRWQTRNRPTPGTKPERRTAGVVVQVTPAVQQDGRVALRLAVDNTTAIKKEDGNFELNVFHLETSATAKQREILRIPCGRSEDGRQRWIEMTFDEK